MKIVVESFSNAFERYVMQMKNRLTHGVNDLVHRGGISTSYFPWQRNKIVYLVRIVSPYG